MKHLLKCPADGYYKRDWSTGFYSDTRYLNIPTLWQKFLMERWDHLLGNRGSYSRNKAKMLAISNAG